MRATLKHLMDKAGHTPYDIARITGLPAATTYRFLEGKIDNPSPSTVENWAKCYGVTEGQLRGHVPLEGFESKTPPPSLKDLLPLEEYQHVKLVKSLDEKTRGILFRLAEALAEPQAEYHSEVCDRRMNNVFPNPQLRVGEARYKPPPAQRHLKTGNERLHRTKSSQSA